MSLLTVSHLRACYGTAEALFDVSFAIEPGQVCALLGRNGMGKTTTIRAICRMLPIAGGDVRFDGQDVSRLPSHRVARLGVGLVPEGRRCFAPLTVRENLIAAARPGHWDMARVTALFPRLGERAGQRALSLSGGEQQMLAIARALMTNPRLLILDEATEGLAPLVRGEIWEAITRLKRETGLAILLVDKSLAEVGRVADCATVLVRGRSVWNGTWADLPDDVTSRHLGI